MEEISLRQIIEIILKGKKSILIITAIFAVVSIIANFFIISPIYEAQVMLRISQSTNNISQQVTEDGATLAGLLGAMSQNGDTSIETYREQIKAPVILQYIREQMNFKGVPLQQISNKISVEDIKNTNLITIKVTDESPDTAAKIANMVSARFTKFITETNQKQAESSGEVLKAQMDKEKKNLDEVSKKLEGFLSKPRGPSELQMELDSKLEQLTNFKTTLAQIKIDESSTAASVGQGKQLLANTPRTLVTKVNLLENDLLADAIRDKTGLRTNEISHINLTTEQINEVYIELSNNVNELDLKLSNLQAERVNTEKAIIGCQKEIETIQTEHAQKQREYDILKQEQDIVKQTYEAYQQKYKESVIKQSIDTGNESIAVVSEALPPVRPIAPRKVFNTAIFMVIGMLLGTFIVVAKEFWYSTDLNITKTIN
ncbi:GumC family protein [Acetivibrio cellulolyticus]|uniref:GumC family protein n=1 Tax=Acetivibrio cellulolyticus TaxID=35830 RepID=UPI0001E2F116|nr:Wzz/FepE/Etk N-terminal domain-containing protein [Acetivibrio cellulolyticus]